MCVHVCYNLIKIANKQAQFVNFTGSKIDMINAITKQYFLKKDITVKN